MENVENWKEVEGYEGLYEVSNLGRVRSLVDNHGSVRKEPKVLKGEKKRDGYLFVILYKDGKRKTFSVHRLVANAFIPNPQNLREVNHKDEDKTNNRVQNLEWCSHEYNNNYGTRNQRVAEKRRGVYNTRTSKAVISTDEFGNEEYFPSLMEAERRYGFKNGHICDCLKGKLKTYKGRTWRYA